MQSLLVDIGNSNTVFSEYESGEIGSTVYIETVELSKKLHEFDSKDYVHVLISSVVPEINILFKEHFSKAVFLTYDMLPMLSFLVDDPSQIGADRLVTAYAVSTLYTGESLVVDSGTAITFERISSNAEYLGGAIFPGMGIASQSLHDYTSKIPLIWVEKQEGLYGKNTEMCVQIGLYHGYLQLINGLIDQYKVDVPNLTVIGAGNGLDIFNGQLHLDVLDPLLQMKGLGLILDDIF